ncbi:hypothetical protein [Actinoplanes subglobosus]|uniref:Uncharacterized protein n=1 Tax=Actinoplanes subglobosus TaxID=1547892 RepID=A0ABV8J6A0_9ACTN
MTGITGGELGREAARRLAERCRDIQPGLTGAEFDRIEQSYGFAFADDHRAFLAAGLPVGGSWPDWRNGDPQVLRDKLTWPVEGVLYDVEHNAYWNNGWGERPAQTSVAVGRARKHLATVPTLVPVYSHRYLPAGRDTSGHPVMSMYQTDIIYYGMNLLDYVYQEFSAGPGIRRSDPRWEPLATVPFWRDLVG